MPAHAHWPVLFSRWPLTSQARPRHSAGARESPNPTHAAAGAASHRRSEDKLHVYFSLFLPCVFLFLFLPRNELSGGPPPAQPDAHTHTSPPPPYKQTRTHSHTHIHTHRRLLCKRRRRRCRCSFFLCCCCCRTSWTKSRWWHGGVLSRRRSFYPPCIMRGCR